MKVLWFYVFDFHPDSTRKAPIGAWITQDDRLDYEFNAAYPDDEDIPSDLINRMLEAGEKLVSREMLEYWQTHVGYYRSAGEIHEEDVSDYGEFLKRIRAAINQP
ncbi:MAG: hypothetical protein Q8M07_02060 [Prosthecobacter sp.]|jgi:hypothetical protein|nr:hypothetical protein [Prosthecobacter sp.]